MLPEEIFISLSSKGVCLHHRNANDIEELMNALIRYVHHDEWYKHYTHWYVYNTKLGRAVL